MKRAPGLQAQLIEMREELVALRCEQEWQRRLGVLAALLPFSGPRGRGWSNVRPAKPGRLPLRRPALSPGEKRVARAAPVLAARQARIEIPQQRPAPAIERLRSLPPPPRTDVWIGQIRQPDGRFGGRTDIQNNRTGR